jgi:hypothetical protein
MSELSSHDEPAQSLPPLRIHHLLVLTAVFSCVMAVVLSIWRLGRSLAPLATMHEFSAWTMFLATSQWLALATSLTILLFGRTWRHKGLPFPSQPGHWIAIYVTAKGCIEMVLSLLTMAISATHLPVHVILSIGTGIPFQVALLIISVAAYRREPIRYWKWGWAATAVYSALTAAMYTFYASVLVYRLLYSLFWVSGPINWRLPDNLGAFFASFGYIYPLIVNYAVLIFILLATTFDMRHLRQRHWSHWVVLVTLGIQYSIYVVYRHWLIY